MVLEEGTLVLSWHLQCKLAVTISADNLLNTLTSSQHLIEHSRKGIAHS